MKKLLGLVFVAASLATSQAATVTVAPGFSNSLTVLLDGVVSPSFHVAIGAWDGTTFTQFSTGIQDTGTVNGTFVATGPASVNSQIIHLYVGLGTEVNLDGAYVLLKSGANTAFPSDVSSAIASATFQANNAAPNVVNFVAGSDGLITGSLVGNQIIFETIPEPSALMLGLLGAAGMLRRRRI